MNLASNIMRHHKTLPLILVIIVLVGCAEAPVHDHEDEGHDHAAETGSSESNKEEVHLLQKQMDVMSIELGHFQFMDLTTTIRANGQLELPPQNIASISSILGGRVERIDVLEGDYVNKGEVIAYLSNPEFIDLQREFLSAKSNFSVLEIDYQRKKELLKDAVNQNVL